MFCDVMGCGLCDVLNWEMMCCELRKAHVTAKPVRRLFQCAVQPCDARHKQTMESPCHRTTTWYHKELLRTTMFYSSTTPYYKVLLQYYSAQQSTSPVLLRKYYSGTTPYYKVLLR